MSCISQVPFDYRFPVGRWPIADLRVRAGEIAQRFGFNLETWEEEGLGPANGMLIRLPSGRVMLLREQEHAIKHHGAEGPCVEADLGDVAALGSEVLMAEVLEALELPRDVVARIAGEDAQRAADFLARGPLRVTYGDPDRR
jgi:hypothetical protein